MAGWPEVTPHLPRPLAGAFFCATCREKPPTPKTQSLVTLQRAGLPIIAEPAANQPVNTRHAIIARIFTRDAALRRPTPSR
jgi:hypothetical protein